MAEIANTAWYRVGTVSVTDESTIVTGNGTRFTTAGINPGATLRLDGRPYAYEVKNVVSDTQLELAKPYYGGTVSNASYSIDRNFQSTTNAKISADMAALMGIYGQLRDGVMLTIEGKSAYQVAVANGFTGTAAQWLESLKGAGDYDELLKAVSPITEHNAGAHNSIARYKNLGTAITDVQIAHIRDDTFRELYIGDFWKFSTSKGIITATLAGFNLWGRSAILWLDNPNWQYQVNDTNTCEGALYGSKLFQEALPEILANVLEVIPEDYIIKVTTPVSDSIDENGFINHQLGAVEQRIFLPTANNLGLDDSLDPRFKRNNPYNNIGTLIWPLSNINNHGTNTTLTWLASNYSTNHWGQAWTENIAAHTTASSRSRVRPYIFIG